MSCSGSFLEFGRGARPSLSGGEERRGAIANMPTEVVADFLSARRFDIRFEDAGDRQIAPLRVSISPDVETVAADDRRVMPSTLPSFPRPAEYLCQYQRDLQGNDDLDAFNIFGVELPSMADLKFMLLHHARVAKTFSKGTRKSARLLAHGIGQRFRQRLDRPWSTRDCRCRKLVVAGENGIEGAAKMSALAA
jgi:hypothetical protein